MNSDRTPPTLTRDAARAIDRLAAEEFGMPTIVLMENAARAAAEIAVTMLPAGGGVLIVAGPGNNGGDGYAMARHLSNAGCPVSIAMLGEPAPGSDAAINALIAQRTGLPAADTLDAAIAALGTPPALIVDALFGTGLSRPPEGPAAATIQRMNELRSSGVRVLSVDIPSGLDCDTGCPLGVAVRADVTVTFVARKHGFMAHGAAEFLGRVVVADIGVPKALVERLTDAPERRGQPG